MLRDAPLDHFSSGPWAAYRAHGDPFPLPPSWIESQAEACELAFPRRGFWSASSLNNLVLHGANSDFDSILQGLPPNRPQMRAANHIINCLEAAGPPPHGMTEDSALLDVGGSNYLYSEEPQNLAPFSFDKVKVLHSKLKPQPLEQVLPPSAKSLLDRATTMIERSADDIARHGTEDFVPYWDPALRRNRKELERFLVGLANSGLVTFRTAIKERIGIFFVKKKTPEWIRMVIDARRVNSLHQLPPTTRLATPRAYADLQLSDPGNGQSLGYGIEADVQDCFYNFFHEGLASFFGVDLPHTAAEWRNLGWNSCPIYDEASGRYGVPESDTTLFPVFRGLCMGWSWALFFANEAVNYIAHGRIPRPISEVRDKQPLPDLSEGAIVGVYVDNISIVASNKSEVTRKAKAVGDFFSAAGVPLTWSSQEPLAEFTTVGIVLDFKTGVIRNKPKRIWKVFFAGRALLRRKKVTVNIIEKWLGHCTSLFMLAPHGLSTFFHIYRFVAKHRGSRAPLWSSVRREIRIALGLIWLAETNIVFRPICQVDAGDSSGTAYALLTTWAKPTEIKHTIKWREGWRYVPVPEVLKRAVSTGDRDGVVKALEALHGSPNGTPIPRELRPGVPCGAGLKTQYAEWLIQATSASSWLRTSAVKSQLNACRPHRVEVDMPALVEPVPADLCRQGRFSLLWRKKWLGRANFHINIKEAKVALTSLKRSARVAELHHHVKLTLCDNLAAILAFEKGRSNSFLLNRVCQQAAAYQFSTGIRWRLRHLETDRNPADRDSRFDKPKGTKKPAMSVPGCVSPAMKAHVLETAAVPSQGRDTAENGLWLGKRRAPLVSRRSPIGIVDSAIPDGKGRHPSQSSSQKRGHKKWGGGDVCFPPFFVGQGLFLEVFSGTGRLTEAFRQQGFAAAHPIDVLNGSHHDLRRRATQLAILSRVRAGWFSYVHIGVPCTVFSRARHAIRNVESAREKERLGIEFLLFSLELIETCVRYGVVWSLENPRSSRIFEFPLMSRLMASSSTFRCDVDFCMYGEAFKKPTTIISSSERISILARQCCHRKHAVVLRGSEQIVVDGKCKTVPKTQRAGAYPFELCASWAQEFGVFVSRCKKEFQIISDQFHHELVSAAKAKKDRRKQIQATPGIDAHLQAFAEQGVKVEQLAVFGQHSQKEAQERRQLFRQAEKHFDWKKYHSRFNPRRSPSS